MQLKTESSTMQREFHLFPPREPGIRSQQGQIHPYPFTAGELGAVLDSRKARAYLPQDRADKIHAALQYFKQNALVTVF